MGRNDLLQYITEIKEANIAVADFVRDFVDVEKFLGFCEQCENYNVRWSCPPYDFDPLEFWKEYKTLKIIGIKIIFNEETAGKEVNHEDCVALYDEVLKIESVKLYRALKKEEKKTKGSCLLNPGCCHLCGDTMCDRNKGACPKPAGRRYSFESLGSDVGKIASELLYFDLLWIEEGKMPSYLCQIGGILYK
jgi:predicted metal-binding protein